MSVKRAQKYDHIFLSDLVSIPAKILGAPPFQKTQPPFQFFLLFTFVIIGKNKRNLTLKSLTCFTNLCSLLTINNPGNSSYCIRGSNAFTRCPSFTCFVCRLFLSHISAKKQTTDIFQFKPRVAVLMGGYTSEYEISLKSGAVVMANIDPNIYEPYAVLITGECWMVELDGTWHPIDRRTFSCGDIHFDVIFNAVHGDPGENGILQSYFDKRGISYTGCSSAVSALTYNKTKTLTYLEPHGIAMARRLYISSDDFVDTKHIVASLGLPCFVKANQGGSSFGVSKVYKEEELTKAIALALEEDSSVLIESFLEGTEVSIAVITYHGDVHVLEPTEIVTDADFFDFSAKYEGKSKEITPARLTDIQRKNVRHAAEKVYTALGMKGLSRSDFIFVGDIPHFLEINTVPGLTEGSLLPQQAQYAGISLAKLFHNALVEAM